MLRELVPLFFLSLAIFTFILILDKIIELTDLVFHGGVSLGTVIKLLLFSFPPFLILTIPFALLSTTVIAFSRLASDSEILALKASGYSIYHFLRPVVGFSGLLCLCSLFLTVVILPMSNVASKKLLFQMVSLKATLGVREGVFNDDFDGLTLYVNKIHHQSSTLLGIFVSDSRNEELPQVIIAEAGRLIADPESERVVLLLSNGAIHRLIGGGKYQVMTFSKYDLSLDVNKALAGGRAAGKETKEMTISELREKIEQYQGEGKNSTPLLLFLYKKFSLPVTSLVMGLLGTPLGMRNRSGRVGGIVTSVGFMILYHVLSTGSEALAQEGKISPLLGVSIPSGVLGFAGVFLITASERNEALRPFRAMQVWRGEL